MHGSMWRREETRPVGNAVQPGASRRPSSDGPYRLGGLQVYGSHTAGHSMLVSGSQVDTDFRKRQEEKFTDCVA
jgi:hypothetical protein